MFTSLKGRSVIVTGSSKGIGRGIALRFAAAGCDVLVVSRRLEEANAVAAQILAEGGSARAVEAAGERMVRDVLRRTLGPFQDPQSGIVTLRNTFRWVAARR